VADYLGHTRAVLLSTYAHLRAADHDWARAVVQAALCSAPCATTVSRGTGTGTGRQPLTCTLLPGGRFLLDQLDDVEHRQVQGDDHGADDAAQDHDQQRLEE
jgi:hypothetical protein